MQKRKTKKTKTISRKKITPFSKLSCDKTFVLADGTKIKSLVDLAVSLNEMPNELFRQHVNIFKNDFCGWIKQTYEDHILANELMTANEKDEVELLIMRKLVKEMK